MNLRGHILTRIALAVLCAAPVAAAQSIVATKSLSVLEQDVRRPEPLVYAVIRQLPHTPVGGGRLILRRQYERYLDMARKDAIRTGPGWSDAAFRRGAAAKYKSDILEIAGQLADLDDKLRSVAGEPRKQEAAERYAERYRLERAKRLLECARDWPDIEIKCFLVGQAKLLAGDYSGAESQFSQCIDFNPYVPGYHQGRALARQRGGDAIASLADWMAVVRLRPEEALAKAWLNEAIESIPTSDLSDPRYIRAKDFAAEMGLTSTSRSVASSSRSLAIRSRYGRSTGNTGFTWLMPGKDWTCRRDCLAIPECDAFFVNDYAVVPVGANGVFLADSQAIQGALAMYLDIPAAGDAPRVLLPVEALDLRRSDYGIAMPDVVLLGLKSPGQFAFEEVQVDAASRFDGKDEWELVSAGLCPELDDGVLRRRRTRIDTPPGAPGPVAVPSILPGEALGFVFSGVDPVRLAALATGRLQIDDPNGGQSRIISGDQLRKMIDEVQELFRAPSSRRRDRSLSALAEMREVPGNAFILHVIVEEK